MNIASQIRKIQSEVLQYNATLVAVTKTQPLEFLMEAYNSGCKIFGENKVQEMVSKFEQLPKDINWHMIGHLQSNKVKFIAPFVTLIHSIDSFSLLQEVNKQAIKNNRIINCLLQVFIATEESKFGFSENEVELILNSEEFLQLKNIKIIGLMGMASNTENINQVKKEFQTLKLFFDLLKNTNNPSFQMQELSIGMSGDYQLALENGSTLIRVGSAIFGNRS